MKHVLVYDRRRQSIWRTMLVGMTYWALTTCFSASARHISAVMAGWSRSLMRATTHSAVNCQSPDPTPWSSALGTDCVYVHTHQCTATPAVWHVRPTGIVSSRLVAFSVVLCLAAAVIFATEFCWISSQWKQL